jgi:hypothetical protein
VVWGEAAHDGVDVALGAMFESQPFRSFSDCCEEVVVPPVYD